MTECNWIPCDECGESVADYDQDGVGDVGPQHAETCSRWRTHNGFWRLREDGDYDRVEGERRAA